MKQENKWLRYLVSGCDDIASDLHVDSQLSLFSPRNDVLHCDCGIWAPAPPVEHGQSGAGQDPFDLHPAPAKAETRGRTLAQNKRERESGQPHLLRRVVFLFHGGCIRAG